jgi:hypothetical protein
MAIAWQRHSIATLATVFVHAGLAGLLLPQLRFGPLAPERANTHSSDDPPAATIATVEVLPSPDRRARDAADVAMPDVPLDSGIRSPDIPVPNLSLAEADDAAAEPTKVQAASFGPAPFHCEVHVHQSKRGAVEAVDFGACNGDSVWQQTLIQSLQRAAELVTPVSYATFAAVRTFTFDTSSVAPGEIARQLSTPK